LLLAAGKLRRKRIGLVGKADLGEQFMTARDRIAGAACIGREPRAAVVGVAAEIREVEDDRRARMCCARSIPCHIISNNCCT